MDALCPLVGGSTDTAHERLTLGAILRAFLPALLLLLKLGKHKLRVLWHLAACGTPALGANLFACPHCPHRHWAPRSCGDRHCPRCLAAKSWQWLEKQIRSLLPIAGSVISKQPARSSNAVAAPWSFSSKALPIRSVAQDVVPRAEKPEFVWWLLPMPPAFCT
jgi:hypothetical protein